MVSTELTERVTSRIRAFTESRRIVWVTVVVGQDDDLVCLGEVIEDVDEAIDLPGPWL
jgi:hypothetical protein